MGILRKIVEKLDDVADKKVADVVEKAGIPPKPEPSPKKSGGANDGAVQR